MPAPTPLDRLDPFGAMVRAARGEMSQDQVAAKLGIAQSYYSAIERGERVDLPSSLLVGLSKVLDLDLADLIRADAARTSVVDVPPEVREAHADAPPDLDDVEDVDLTVKKFSLDLSSDSSAA